MNSSTRKPAEDGGARGRMTRISSFIPMNTNQNVTDNLVQRRADFQELANALVAKVARKALDKNPNLTPKQKEHLRDAERGRYGNKLVALLLEAMAGSGDPLAFADQVRETTLQGITDLSVPCVLGSYIDNTRAQKDADVAQALFLIERTSARRDQLADALGPEETTLHFHKLAVLGWNPTGRKVFA